MSYIEVIFNINGKTIVALQDFYKEEEIQIDETSFTLKNVSDVDRNILLPQLREIKLEKLINNIDVAIQVIISYYNRIGMVTKRFNLKTYLDSDLTFSIKESEIFT